MIDLVRTMLASQFQAALSMLNDCIDRCPLEHWDGRIARYPFWQVAYHTLCYADLYLSPGRASFELRPDLHPAGWSEFNDEYPSRRFEQPELAGYIATCRDKAVATLAAETPETLAAGSGFDWLPFSRGEVHVYNIRHIQHHAAHLSLRLRIDAGVEIPWVRSGWRE